MAKLWLCIVLFCIVFVLWLLHCEAETAMNDEWLSRRVMMAVYKGRRVMMAVYKRGPGNQHHAEFPAAEPVP